MMQERIEIAERETRLRQQSRRFRLLVFDWDGTVVDSTAPIVSAVQAAYRDLELTPPEESAVRYIIGLKLDTAFFHLSPDLPEKKIARLLERYRYHYFQGDADIPLFKGMSALLEKLDQEDYFLAVATGKSRKGLDRMLRQKGMTQRFHATRCADESFSKPHPEMLLHLMDRLGATPEQTLMIGDTTHDIQMAKNARACALAVSYGAHDKDNLRESQPLAIVDSVAALDTWLAANG
ncbi:MAG: HAD-IA family hydrolase [Burkholderiales bacterium]|jgi:phosphoglycolate phosphatase|nr:HAD-IA family hydrolase [Burkholderiales bacterium]